MGLSLDQLDPPLDDIAYLARSNNRIAVLEALVEGERTRGELHGALDVSRPTLGRILEGCVERGWVTETDRTYALTPLGRLLVEEFGELMETTRAVQQLRDLAPQLPLAEMPFDLRRLADATITTPSPTDASAHFRREATLLDGTDHIRFLCNQAQPETVEAYRDRVVEADQRLEAVISGDAIDAAAAHPEMGRLVREMVTAENATIYRYDGPVTVMLGLLDDVASIVPLDENGVPCAFIESDDPAVRDWVTETFEAHREEAELVTVDALTA